MENKTKILIGVGIFTLIGLVFLYKKSNKNSDSENTEDKEKDTKTDENKASKSEDKKSNDVPTSPKDVSQKTTQSKPTSTIVNADVVGKKVSDALLKNDPKNLFGKKVYANYDNTVLYTTTGKLYTKAKKGQLLGTFSHVTPMKSGKKAVTIVSNLNDPKNKFIIAEDGFLTF